MSEAISHTLQLQKSSHAMTQFALNIDKLPHIIRTAPILEMAALTVSVPDYSSCVYTSCQMSYQV